MRPLTIILLATAVMLAGCEKQHTGLEGGYWVGLDDPKNGLLELLQFSDGDAGILTYRAPCDAIASISTKFSVTDDGFIALENSSLGTDRFSYEVNKSTLALSVPGSKNVATFARLQSFEGVDEELELRVQEPAQGVIPCADNNSLILIPHFDKPIVFGLQSGASSIRITPHDEVGFSYIQAWDEYRGVLSGVIHEIEEPYRQSESFGASNRGSFFLQPSDQAFWAPTGDFGVIGKAGEVQDRFWVATLEEAEISVEEIKIPLNPSNDCEIIYTDEKFATFEKWSDRRVTLHIRIEENPYGSIEQCGSQTVEPQSQQFFLDVSADGRRFSFDYPDQETSNEPWAECAKNREGQDAIPFSIGGVVMKVKRAALLFDEETNVPQLGVEVTRDERKFLRDLTQAQQGQIVKIMVGSEVIARPRFRERISGGTVVFDGNFSLSEAANYARIILPACAP